MKRILCLDDSKIEIYIAQVNDEPFKIFYSWSDLNSWLIFDLPQENRRPENMYVINSIENNERFGQEIKRALDRKGLYREALGFDLNILIKMVKPDEILEGINRNWVHILEKKRRNDGKELHENNTGYKL